MACGFMGAMMTLLSLLPPLSPTLLFLPLLLSKTTHSSAAGLKQRLSPSLVWLRVQKGGEISPLFLPSHRRSGCARLFLSLSAAAAPSLSFSSHVVGGKEDDDGRTDVGRAKRLPPPPPPSSRTLTFSPADRLRSCFSRDLRLAERGREGNRSRSPRR